MESKTDSPAPVILTRLTGTPLDIIRTETVLSKLPIHNLAKKGKINIQILRTASDGQIELKWEVSYSDRYGQARQLAYKLDTIVIDQKIDEIGKPLPERIRLGSINQIAQELNIDSDQGNNTKNIRKAFLQNASTFITAKLTYRANDGVEHSFEAGFTRYTVIFTGQKFSDGRRADAVYIELHPRYREVLNNAPTRPLDLRYKKQLLPAAQRFYEIVSYKIFAALKNHQSIAKLPYSEYCVFSAQQRYFNYDHFKKQMYKILKPHKTAEYITEIRYEQTSDEQGLMDWMMCFTPGSRAYAEYVVFTGKQPKISVASTKQLPAAPLRRPTRPRQKSLPLEAAVDPQHLEALLSRGVSETQARKFLTELPSGFPVLDTLQWADDQIRLQPGKFTNPPGFYISLLQGRITPPPTFTPPQARETQQRALYAQQQAFLERQATADLAEEEEKQKLDAQIAVLPDVDRAALLEQSKTVLLADYPNMVDYFKTHPEAETEDEALRGVMRALLKNGWVAAPAPEPHRKVQDHLL